MATLPADLDAVTSLPTTVTANVTTGHTGHSELIHKALRAIETAWASLAETGALDAEAIRDLMGTVILGTGLITVTPSDPSDTVTISTTATANSTDATLLARANHTGTQDPATTLTAWVEAVVDAVAPALVSGVHTNISFAYDDAAGKINATAVGGSGGGPIPASSITDSTTFGRAVLTAVDAATARAAIGAGTSNLVIGTLVTQAKAGNYQPTAANISDSTATGRSLIVAADAAAVRLAAGLNLVNNVDLLDDTTSEILPAFIPFGISAGQVAEGPHAHSGALINVYNAAGSQLTAAPAIQFLGDAVATYNATSQRVEVNVANTLSGMLIRSGTQFAFVVDSDTLQDVPTLTFAVAAATNYRIHWMFRHLTPTPCDVKLAVVFPAGATTLSLCTGFMTGYDTASPAVLQRVDVLATGTVGTFRGVSPTHAVVEGDLLLMVGDTAGTFKLQAAAAVAALGTPQMAKGSFLEWHKV